MRKSNLNEYELLYVVHPRLTADEVTALAETVSDQVRNGGGEVLGVNHWGKRRLAYPIAHQLEGFYILAAFRMPPTLTVELERSLTLSQQVLRHLLVKGILGDPAAPAPDDVAARSARGFAPTAAVQADHDADDGDGELSDDDGSDMAASHSDDDAVAAEADDVPAAEGEPEAEPEPATAAAN